MTITNELQPHSNYYDGQLVQLLGPDNTALTYQYDGEQRAFYVRDALITATAKHGATHIDEDPVPVATCGTPGLMSSNDKCKLDTIVGTRLGVLGFQGSGFPDSGGWMQGDVILAAGSELISLERVGNIIRFVVDVPTPFTCTAESCFQVYWLQDETDVNAIRPPSCNGRAPGVNAYGELKIYLFPESTILSTSNTSAVLGNKEQYPTLIFKRYDDGVGVNQGELDMVLARNANSTATVGWSFTPGPTGTPTCRWAMGLATDGNLITFDLSTKSDSRLLGAILYGGSSITKQMAIITGYQSDVLATNRYKAKWWSLSSQVAIGDEFTVINIQQWDIPNNTKVLDSTTDSILPVGQFIDVWTVQISGVNCYYCKETPPLDASGMWATLGAVQFGDALLARNEFPGASTSEGSTVTLVNDASILDPYEWGLTNADDPLAYYINDASIVPASSQFNYTGIIVSTSQAGSTPGHQYLEVLDDAGANGSETANVQRPICIWNRASIRNALMEIHFARPTAAASGIIYPPIDILMRAPISAVDSKYGVITGKGTFSALGPYVGYGYLKVTGLHWHDLPPHGAVKVIGDSSAYSYGQTVTYIAKLMDGSGGKADGNIYLVSTDASIPTEGVIEALHEEYTTPATRLQFAFNSAGGSAGSSGTDVHDILMQPIVGTLNMGIDYMPSGTAISGGTIPQNDDFVKDFSSATTGSIYWQDGNAETTTTGIVVSQPGFYIADGCTYNNIEYYNVLKVMVVEQQVWLWWNNLLLAASATQPYYPIEDAVKYGKFGLRLWPGSKVRRVIVRSQLLRFSAYTLGQLTLS